MHFPSLFLNSTHKSNFMIQFPGEESHEAKLTVRPSSLKRMFAPLLALFKPRVYRRQIPARSLGAYQGVTGSHLATSMLATVGWSSFRATESPEENVSAPFQATGLQGADLEAGPGRHRLAPRLRHVNLAPIGWSSLDPRAAMEGDGAGDDRTWDGGRRDGMVRQLDQDKGET